MKNQSKKRITPLSNQMPTDIDFFQQSKQSASKTLGKSALLNQQKTPKAYHTSIFDNQDNNSALQIKKNRSKVSKQKNRTSTNLAAQLGIKSQKRSVMPQQHDHSLDRDDQIMFNILTSKGASQPYGNSATTTERQNSSSNRHHHRNKETSMQQQNMLNNIVDNALGLYDQLHTKKQKKKLADVPKLTSFGRIEMKGINEAGKTKQFNATVGSIRSTSNQQKGKPSHHGSALQGAHRNQRSLPKRLRMSIDDPHIFMNSMLEQQAFQAQQMLSSAGYLKANKQNSAVAAPESGKTNNEIVIGGQRIMSPTAGATTTVDSEQQKQSILRSRQLITKGHISKLLDQSQNNWENFLYGKAHERQPLSPTQQQLQPLMDNSIFSGGELDVNNIKRREFDVSNMIVTPQPSQRSGFPNISQNEPRAMNNTGGQIRYNSIQSRNNNQALGLSSKQVSTTTRGVGNREAKGRKVLENGDYERIQEFDALPRACILKNLIKQRRIEPLHELQRDEVNFISQKAALYSANPINSVLEDQIEQARAQSRGNVDYDKIVRSSLYSTDAFKKANEMHLNTPEKMRLGGDSEMQMLNSVMSSPRVASRGGDYLGSAGSPYHNQKKRSGTTGIKSRRLFGNLIKSDGIHNQLKLNASHHSSIHSEARSEYGLEDVDDFERMSHIKAEENDFDGGDQEEFQILQRSIISRARQRQAKRPAGAEAGENEPAKRYEESVKSTLADIRTGLSSDTNVENMISCVTNKYLQKYAKDDSKNKIDQAMQDFMEKHANFDIMGKLKEVEHTIAQELFNISRVVDDGNFHILLDNATVTKLNLIYNIPTVCKISLEGQMPPLHIKVIGIQKQDNITVFCSYREPEPSQTSHDMVFYQVRSQPVRIPGERGPKPTIKVFHSSFLYITFMSNRSTSIEVRPQFVDPQKANSIKYVTSKDQQKFDQSNTGVDAPTVPPQPKMIDDFKQNKQNYTDLKTMIEETRKKDNQGFGQEVVKAAQAVREKREGKNVKKDFLAQHATSIKQWQNVVQEQHLVRKIHQDHKMSKAAQKKQEVIAEKHMKAIKKLSYWDEYRERKESLMTMFFQAKQQLAMKKAWVHMISVHAIISLIWRKYKTKYHMQCLADAKDLACTRIRGRFKISMKYYYAQYEEHKKVALTHKHKEVNKELLQTRNMRRTRTALTFVGGPVFNKVTEQYAMENLLKPTLEKTSFYFNFLDVARKTARLLGKIEKNMLYGGESNRAKMNVLQITWEKQMEMLTFQYIQKNKKKEHSGIIGQLSAINVETRDKFLSRYLARCKLLNALAFFQWRYSTAQSQESAEQCKSIFQSRIDSLVRNIEESIKKKKQMAEDAKDGEKSNTSKRKVLSPGGSNSITITETGHKLQKMDTEVMNVMGEQKRDASIFEVVVDTKNKISSFEMIGWTDPNQPNPQKPLKWLKSLTIENYVYPQETFDEKNAPNCIFLPEPAMFNKMIEAVAKHSENRDQLYAKFSDMEPQKPQWMIEQDLLWQEQAAERKRLAREADSFIGEVTEIDTMSADPMSSRTQQKTTEVE